jgi:hypothetical protein
MMFSMKKNHLISVLSLFLLLLTIPFSAVYGEEDNDEFTPLFDGESLAGWEVKAGPDSIWKVVDGAIKCEGSGHPRGWLGTQETYRNFVLRLDWKIVENGNSGVFLRVGDDPDQNPAYDAIEVQIVDDHGSSYTRDDRKPSELSGGIYAIVGPSNDSMYNGANQWNTYVITANEDHIVIEYNGEKVVDILAGDYAAPFMWFDRMRPGLMARPHEGYIALQSHGSEVWFRNIAIKELE